MGPGWVDEFLSGSENQPLQCTFRYGRRIASTHASNCITAKRPQFPTKTAFRGEGALVPIPTDYALAALSDTKDAQFRPFLSSTHAQVRVQRRRFLVPITIPASQPGQPSTRLPGCPLLLGHPYQPKRPPARRALTRGGLRRSGCDSHPGERSSAGMLCRREALASGGKRKPSRFLML